MDQIKIGKFIAERRKQQSLTQLQLAEKLNITDRAVSKWERGKSLPDTSIMLELCNILQITVNDLLNGEVVSMDNTDKKKEQLLIDMAKELELKNKIVWTSMWTILITSMIMLLTGIFIVRLFVPDGTQQLILVIGLCIVFLPLCFYALKLEVSVGAYKCKECGHEITPTYIEALNAIHIGTTRYLKCTKCNKRTWCKKLINKE